MTVADLARIESELQVRLPADYRAFMLLYPSFLRDAYYNSPVGGRASDALLFANPSRVIDRNRDWREDDFLLGEDDTHPRPDRHLIIGEDCGGNCWCVKVGVEDCAIWFFDHADGSLERSAASLAEHVEHLRQHIAEIDRCRKARRGI